MQSKNLSIVQRVVFFWQSDKGSTESKQTSQGSWNWFMSTLKSFLQYAGILKGFQLYIYILQKYFHWVDPSVIEENISF